MGEISKIIKKADINQVLIYLQILAKYKGCTEGVNSKSILKKIQLQVDLMSFIFHVLLVGFSHWSLESYIARKSLCTSQKAK